MKLIPKVFVLSICFSIFIAQVHGQDTEITPGEIIVQDGAPRIRLFDGGQNEVGDFTSFLGALLIRNPLAGSLSQTIFENNGKTNLQLFSDGDAYFKYKVGIGNANPQERLEVNGNMRVYNGSLRINQPSTSHSSSSNGIRFIDQSASNEWRIMNTGTTFSIFKDNTRRAFIASDGTYNVISDARFKENVRSMGAVLDRVVQLRPVTYNYTNVSHEDRSTGFIAQEVQKLFPEAVAVSDDKTLGVNYDYFAVLSVQAIKEQQEMIEKLRQENIQILEMLRKMQNEIAAESIKK